MYETLVRSLSKYVDLSEKETAIIQSLFLPRKYRKRQYILQEGEIARYETFMVKGLARVYEVDDKGQEHVVQFGLEDWWIGDMYSFLTETPSKYTIDCLEDTEVLQITKPNLDILYANVPKMERHFRIMIQKAFISSVNRVGSTLAKKAGERYQEFILKYPEIEQRVADHQIASYLGITPQSLSRIRSK
ncbi:Crp/Fnr family transcriptional regulator [Flavitalea flava]